MLGMRRMWCCLTGCSKENDGEGQDSLASQLITLADPKRSSAYNTARSIVDERLLTASWGQHLTLSVCYQRLTALALAADAIASPLTSAVERSRSSSLEALHASVKHAEDSGVHDHTKRKALCMLLATTSALKRWRESSFPTGTDPSADCTCAFSVDRLVALMRNCEFDFNSDGWRQYVRRVCSRLVGVKSPMELEAFVSKESSSFLALVDGANASK